jgi:hypothetical protein
MEQHRSQRGGFWQTVAQIYTRTCYERFNHRVLQFYYTRAVCKVRGLTLWLRVGTSWRCGDGLFFEVPPLASDILLKMLHFSETCCRPSITSKYLASELPFHIWKSPKIAWIEIWIEFCVRNEKSGSVEPHQNIRHTVQNSPGPCNFWAFPTMKRELRGKKFRSDQRSAAGFREAGGALYEVRRLPREVLRKRDRHRTSTKFLLGVIRWVHELCKRPSYDKY